MNCKDCQFRPVARRLCSRHYQQVKRHGYVFASIKEPRFATIIDGVWGIPIGVNAKDGYALVDEEYVYLEKYNWSLSHGYPTNRGAGLLHRKIMNASEGIDVDHINGNRLDCRRANLRLCTRAQNNMNRTKENKTGFKGVYWHKEAKKWASRIMYKRKSYHLGLFEDIEDAAMAYDTKAKEFFGEFARVNHG